MRDYHSVFGSHSIDNLATKKIVGASLEIIGINWH